MHEYEASKKVYASSGFELAVLCWLQTIFMFLMEWRFGVGIYSVKEDE